MCKINNVIWLLTRATASPIKKSFKSIANAKLSTRFQRFSVDTGYKNLSNLNV